MKSHSKQKKFMYYENVTQICTKKRPQFHEVGETIYGIYAITPYYIFFLFLHLIIFIIILVILLLL